MSLRDIGRALTEQGYPSKEPVDAVCALSVGRERIETRTSVRLNIVERALRNQGLAKYEMLPDIG